MTVVEEGLTKTCYDQPYIGEEEAGILVSRYWM
jgi:hypothetical protein